MARLRSGLLLVVLLSLPVGLLACGSDTEGSGGGNTSSSTGSGGKHTPAPNGIAVDEDAACQTLLAALESKRDGLSCTATLRTCPALVRTVGGDSCLQYDQATISGCATYYQQASDCPDFQARIDNCAFLPIEGSVGLGCPQS